LLLALPIFVAGVSASFLRALASGWRANRPVPGRSPVETLSRRSLTALLFLLQPLARLAGRLRNGLSPWRRRLRPGAAWPRPRTVQVWSETWREPQARIQALQDALAARGAFVRSGGPFDRWDLGLRAGPLGGVKIRTAVEEHGSGRQLMRVKIWPRASAGGVLVVMPVALLAAFALIDGQIGIGTMIAVATLLIVGLGLEGTGTAMSLALAELRRMQDEQRADSDGGPDNGPRGGGGEVSPSLPPSSLPREREAALVKQLVALPETQKAPR
jgi:hypothetical protein